MCALPCAEHSRRAGRCVLRSLSLDCADDRDGRLLFTWKCCGRTSPCPSPVLSTDLSFSPSPLGGPFLLLLLHEPLRRRLDARLNGRQASRDWRLAYFVECVLRRHHVPDVGRARCPPPGAIFPRLSQAATHKPLTAVEHAPVLLASATLVPSPRPCACPTQRSPSLFIQLRLRTWVAENFGEPEAAQRLREIFEAAAREREERKGKSDSK